MTPPRRSWAAPIALLPACFGLVGAFACQGATQVKVAVFTDLPCEQVRGRGTAITVGGPDEDLETKPAARVSLSCNERTGALGELVIVPTSDERDAEFAFKVVTAVTVDSVDQCVAPAYEGCIVSRRVLRYEPQTTLRVNVIMRSTCLGIACDATTTCAENNECRPSFEDPELCARFGTCNPPPPTGGAGGAGGSGGSGGAGGSAGDAGEGGAGQGGQAGSSGAGGDAGQGGQGGGPIVKPASFSTGYAHTCAMVSGQLRCWGQQGYYPPATPTVWSVNGRDFGKTPAALGDLPPGVAFIATGWQSACAGTEAGTEANTSRPAFDLLCFGGNDRYVLGNQPAGQGGGPPAPTPIAIGNPWVQLAAGSVHACGLKDGDVYCWGADNNNQRGTRRGVLLGSESYADNVITRVTENKDWVLLEAGDKFTCGVRKNGFLYCWGDNARKQLGHMPVNPTVNGPLAQGNRVPPPSVNPGGLWLQVSTGTAHACAILSDRSPWCWGANDKGQCNPPTTSDVSIPSPIQTGLSCSDIAAGEQHTCCLSLDAKALSCWGDNTFGQLGRDQATPGALNAVTDPEPDVPWGDVDAGAFHTCASKGANLYCWGKNEQGQLGLGDVPLVKVPTLVPLPR